METTNVEATSSLLAEHRERDRDVTSTTFQS